MGNENKPYTPLAAGPGYQKIIWKDLKAGDEGLAFDALANAAGMGYSSFVVQVEGVFSGAEVQLSGCVIPEKYNLLDSFDYSDIRELTAVDSVKPMVVGGDKDTCVTVGLLVSR